MSRKKPSGSGNFGYRHGNGSNSSGILATASATANTKGSYAELVASTTYVYEQLAVFFHYTGGTVADILIDIAIGSAGSEKDVLRNFQLTCGSQTFKGFVLDVRIPAGSRISARIQATTGSVVIAIAVVGLTRADGFEGSTYIEDEGQNTADSGGVGVDPGATANTKGSWAELTATTSYNYKGFYVAFGKRANATDASISFMVDIGVGAASSEKVIAANIPARSTAAEVSYLPEGPYYVDIPSGSRIAARAQCSSTDATDRLCDIVIYPIIGVSDEANGSGNFYYRHGDDGASNGVTVTASATANTNGSYAELVASTTYEYKQLYITIFDSDATTNDLLVDIAIGVASSEKDIISDLLVTCDDQVFKTFAFDVLIPAGSRISARCQATTGSSTCKVMVQGGVRNDVLGPYMIETIGSNTADSGGTGLDPGGTISTKGAWAEVTASTSREYAGFLIGFGKRANSADTSLNARLDVGIGAASSEKVILADIAGHSTTIEKSDMASGPYYVCIPAGSRLAVRAQCNSTDATDRLMDAVIYGIVA